MPHVNLTGKQEKFAHLVAQGETQSDAYREAYNAENMPNEQIWTEACEVRKNPKVSKRIIELRQLGAQKTAVTIESITEELDLAWNAAMMADDNGKTQPSAAVAASKVKAQLNGLMIEKREIKTDQNINFSQLSDEELAKIATGSEEGNGD